MIETIVNFILFAMLVATGFAIVYRVRLFAVVILAGVFSLLTALLFISLDAVDVAFTEAAVGAGISTVLMLVTIALMPPHERAIPPPRSNIIPLLVIVVVGATLIYGTLDMPNFGDAIQPAQMHVAPWYLHNTPADIAIPNVVTAILASYRGYDTLGETAVVFTAGVGVVVLLSSLGRSRKGKDKDL